MLDHNTIQVTRTSAHGSGKGGRIPPSPLPDSIIGGRPRPSAQSNSPPIEKASGTNLDEGKTHDVSTRDCSYDSNGGEGGGISVGHGKGVSSSLEGEPAAALGEGSLKGKGLRMATDVCFLLRNLYMGGELDVQQQGCKSLPMDLMNTLTLQLGTMRKVVYLSARCWVSSSSL